ncbi:slipin family protein [Candidatus Micrarchaeota archaeon]|nr:slipin family protein [Candidatus Micrarchaeota archaeon]MBD3417545.1 slipin family protein [Candidatus Micrarchaeota archaeon]
MLDLTCGLLPVIAVIGIFFFVAAVRIVPQYKEGVLLTFGRYTRDIKPGLNIIIPIVHTLLTVDKRITTVDIPKQEVMTKDNVPVMVNAVVYFRVHNTKDAILEIQNYTYAVAQYAQTALRDVIGRIDLDTLLTERESIASDIKKLVDEETDKWGVDITAIKIQDVELPTDMKRAMARQAEAEREKRATIILSSGELEASENLRKAAENLAKSSGGMHLRTLQTLSDVSADQSNTLVFVTPIEVLRAIEGVDISKFLGKKEAPKKNPKK